MLCCQHGALSGQHSLSLEAFFPEKHFFSSGFDPRASDLINWIWLIEIDSLPLISHMEQFFFWCDHVDRVLLSLGSLPEQFSGINPGAFFFNQFQSNFLGAVFCDFSWRIFMIYSLKNIVIKLSYAPVGYLLILTSAPTLGPKQKISHGKWNNYFRWRQKWLKIYLKSESQ